jgi:simple sugar transport system ATP-binding protein
MPGPGEPPFLQLIQISKTYGGTRALHNVNLSLPNAQAHCLAGGNGSGKSTLVKIIAGAIPPDPGGRILVHGQLRKHWTPTTAIHAGIEVIYQDLCLFPNLTVAENVALSRAIAHRHFWLSKKQLLDHATRALEQIRAPFNPHTPVAQLSMAQQQLVAIARALTAQPRLLIMDEPTTALTRREIDHLFTIVRSLLQHDITLLFVSHKLDEILEIASQVTILRDGHKIGTYPASALDPHRLETYIAGSPLPSTNPTPPPAPTTPRLRIHQLSRRGQFYQVSLEIHPAEIVGLTGLLGSGRTELALTLFGLQPPDSGQVFLDNQSVTIRSASDALHAGLALVPENRIEQGLVIDHSIAWNLTLPQLPNLTHPTGLLSPHRESQLVHSALQQFQIRATSPRQPVDTLSGGNQQRVLLGKWLATQPRVLILDNPTAGIDVAAKHHIHQLIKHHAHAGMAILLLSDELPELLALTHRLYVMHQGRITAQFVTRHTTAAQLRTCLESPTP